MPSLDTRPHACPHCPRRLSDRNALSQHLRWKHGLGRAPRPRQRVAEEDEESLAAIAVRAEEKRLCGEPLTDLERSLLA